MYNSNGLSHIVARHSSGFVTTTRVTHATPAPLYAHGPNRKWEADGPMPESASRCKDIARQLVEDEPGRNIKARKVADLYVPIKFENCPRITKQNWKTVYQSLLF